MYEAHFGLSDLPFQISPDARFYVDAAPHCAALNALLAGLRRSDEFMLLTGDFGTGKTTVARRLLEEVDRERFAVAELRGLRLEGDDVFDRIAEVFGMRPLESHHRLAAMLRILEDIAHGRGKALLVIDEAQAIGLDCLRRLRKLTALRIDGRSVLHVCLAGRSAPPGIEDLLRLGRPLTIGTTFHLEALDGADTRNYVLHRLRQVGWTGRPAFDKDVTAEIHACCEGNPARINRLCAHILLQLYMQGRDDTSAGIVRAVDTLMRSELEGEPAVVDLPPAARAAPREPDTVLEPFSRPPEEEEASVDIEALMTRPLVSQLPALRHADGDSALTPWRPRSEPENHRAGGRARSPRWLRAGAALVLFVGGGFTWHALNGRLAAPMETAGAATAGNRVGMTSTGSAIRPAADAAHPAAADVATAPGADARALLTAVPGAPAALVAGPSAAIPVAGTPTLPQAPGAPADTADLEAAAQHAIATAPPAAGGSRAEADADGAPRRAGHPSSADASVIAAMPAPLREPPRAGTASERHRPRARPPAAEEHAMADRSADTRSAAVPPDTCTATREALALCGQAGARSTSAAPPHEEAAARTAPPAPSAHAAPSPRGCDRTQAVLGLCNGP